MSGAEEKEEDCILTKGYTTDYKASMCQDLCEWQDDPDDIPRLLASISRAFPISMMHNLGNGNKFNEPVQHSEP